MIQTIVEFGLVLGFTVTGVGFFLLFLAVVRPNLSIQRIVENNSLHPGERMKRVNDDLLASFKSRLGQIGQFLMTIGVSVLILTGVIWLALQIFGTQSVPS